MTVSHVETFSIDGGALSRAQADQLWDDLGEALGYGRRGAALVATQDQLDKIHAKIDRLSGDVAADLSRSLAISRAAKASPIKMVDGQMVAKTPEEEAAENQVLSKLAAQAAVAPPQVRDGSAIGSGQMH